MNNVTINPKSTLSKKAYDFIRNKIISGEIKDGDVITEQNVGNILNMSRTPVKKALTQLELENYVRCVDGVGTIVIGLSIKDLADVYEVRMNIETLALKSSIQRIGDKELDEFKAKLLRILDMYKGKQALDAAFVTKVDGDFHNLILDNTKNNYVKYLMSFIAKQIERYQYEAYSLTDTGEESTNQHIKIIDQMKKRDYKKAKLELEKHIKWSYEVLTDALSNIDK